MSALQGAPTTGGTPGASRGRRILWTVVGVWVAGIVFFAAIYGLKSHKAPAVASGAFSPIDEFKLDTWFKLGPIDFNKGVLYLLLTIAITVGIMGYVARRLRQRPGRLQVAIEWCYEFSRSMARENLDDRLMRKYFPLIATLFVFILVTNLIGYIPLPVDSTNKFNLFGAHIPSFQIYAADTNVAFPLILTLLVFILFNYEGIRHHGFIGYIKSLIPSGIGKGLLPLITVIEILSVFLRLISLSVRLWANLLAGHLLIAFMSGELGVLVGQTVVSWALLPLGIAIFMFEATLIAVLQAFIFAILTAIYIGSSVSSH
ncbi:MAG TPA: F0F1 ATP synthase subunit A [Solirubrobacteraceae bacterium]|nr:F0F1 ATP synthase subunit A [Solirubrobacteraceae bacterium]